MRRIFLCVLLLAATASLSACQKRFEWSQKLTIVVETPDGEKSGSAIVHEVARYGEQWLGDPLSTNFTGEATMVEVAPGKYLFALLGNPYTNGLAFNVWSDVLPKTPPEARLAMIETLRETRPVPPEHYPLLVTFGDLNDPKSVQKVDPANLAATFGAGYGLKGIKLEITGEKVTEGAVEKVLGWLGPYPEPKLGPAPKNSNDIPFYREVTQGNFIRR